jgi:hypothetical protein
VSGSSLHSRTSASLQADGASNLYFLAACHGRIEVVLESWRIVCNAFARERIGWLAGLPFPQLGWEWAFRERPLAPSNGCWPHKTGKHTLRVYKPPGSSNSELLGLSRGMWGIVTVCHGSYLVILVVSCFTPCDIIGSVCIYFSDLQSQWARGHQKVSWKGTAGHNRWIRWHLPNLLS